MTKFLQAINAFLGLVLTVVVLGAVAAGGWWVYSNYYAEKQASDDLRKELNERKQELADLRRELSSKLVAIEELNRTVADLQQDLREKEKEIKRLATAVKLLKVDRRVAFVDVLDQDRDDQGNIVRTEFRFVEVDDSGKPLAESRTFTVEGDKVFLDALVIKFDDHFVEEGDPLRATSLCLFQRVYGEKQAPAEGFRLDPEGDRPAAYATGNPMSPFERELWSKFWEYAADVEKSRDAGIRAAHGQVVYLKVREGVRYKVTLRASDGLTMVPEGAVPEVEEGTL
ncbi:hypothetical protein JCM19992_34180 [Thermostilla marina]